MKQSHTAQHSIFDFYPEHEFGQELKFISDGLDNNSDLINTSGALWESPKTMCCRWWLCECRPG